MEKHDKDLVNVRVAVVKNRAHTEWINIEDIVPNPLNPRKDDSIKTEELQSIIKKQGWEMPITCYKKGNIYVVLSGHRRLYAAKQAKIRQIPVFIVEAPKTMQDEIERIASAQLAQEDWSSLEWARFTYERWLAWGRPGMKKFSEEIGLNRRTVESYVRVLDYFPMSEIEGGLIRKELAMRSLYDVVMWIFKLKTLHHSLIENLSEDMIRRLMLEKLVNKKISLEGLRKKDFLEKVKTADLKRFLTDKNMHLEELMMEYEFNVKEKTFHAQTVSVGLARKAVKNFNPKNANEAKRAFDTLRELEQSLKLQVDYIKRKYPSVAKKDDLFDWDKK